jgi:serine/threonine protein kinase
MLDAYETDSEFLIVLELIEDGCTLEDWIVDNEIQSETFAKCFFRQLVEAVRECHREGILHRDLKESNILMDKTKQEPKLIDFGFSNLIENSPFNECVGTFGHMAPEVYDESKLHDGLPTEVFSLGVILYDMLTCSLGLQSLFEEEDNDNESVGKDDENDSVVLPDVSIECIKLIHSMLDSCPGNRPTIEKILQHPWLQ